MPFESLKKLGIKLLNRSLSTVLPDWYYCQTWKWGNIELAARNQLLDNSKSSANTRLYCSLVSESRRIIFQLLNKTYGGAYLEDSITNKLSIRDFKQIYLVLVALFLMRLDANGVTELHPEILSLFPGEDELIGKLIYELKDRSEDESKQAIFAWGRILHIIDGHDISPKDFWVSSFVLFAKCASKTLRDSSTHHPRTLG
jgi:hypothetical protein